MTLLRSTCNPSPSSGGVLPPFSWSLQRRKMFEFCRRAYYFHYYGAAGGWDQHEPERTRLIYRLKQLRDVESWLRQILDDALSQTFLTRRPQFKDNLVFMSARLRQACAIRFRREWNDLERENWRNDPKLLNLVEIYYSSDLTWRRKIFDYAQLRLEQLYRSFVTHPLATVLSDLDSSLFRHFRRPAATTINGYEIWLAPTLAWQEDDRLNVLALTDQATEVSLYAALLQQWATETFRFAPDLISVCEYNPGTTDTEPELLVAEPCPREEAEAEVAAGIDEMLAYASAGTAHDLEAFPKGEQGEKNCCKCRFSQLCHR